LDPSFFEGFNDGIGAPVKKSVNPLVEMGRREGVPSFANQQEETTMSSRAANVVVTTSLAAIAILAIGVTHYSPSHAKLGLAVFQLLIGFGLLTTLFAVFPSSHEGGAKFDRAADFSRMSLEVRVSRPLLMRCGMLAFGIGLLGKGLAQLSGGIF
jgi:hypothetical protein